MKFLTYCFLHLIRIQELIYLFTSNATKVCSLSIPTDNHFVDLIVLIKIFWTGATKECQYKCSKTFDMKFKSTSKTKCVYNNVIIPYNHLRFFTLIFCVAVFTRAIWHSIAQFDSHSYSLSSCCHLKPMVIRKALCLPNRTFEDRSERGYISDGNY